MSNESIDTAGTVSLKYIVANTRARMRKDAKDDMYIMQYAIDCITELNMFHLDVSGPKTALLPVSDIGTIDVPEDYIDYYRLGGIVNGRIQTFTLNPKLAIPTETECGEDVNPWKDITLDFPARNTFGAGGGYNTSEYRYDQRNRRFIIGGATPGTYVVLEYVSSGVSVSEETFIPRLYVPAIRAYIIWQFVENDEKAPMNDKMRKGQLYADEVMRAGESLNIDEIMDAVYSGYRRTIKR